MGVSESVSTEQKGALVRLAGQKRVVVCVGAGGVGKTTIAACLGLLGAGEGRRVLVLTIDPARRLAVALGLGSLEHEPKEVPGDKMRAAGFPVGLLRAMVLDQKRTFDEVIARHAPDEATRARIMENKLYRELSTRLAGGQEYAASEKLYDAFSASESDLLVLDTPPTANAIDFLEAPRKMVGLLEGPAVRLFVRSYEQAGRFSFKVLSLGAAYVFKRLARFVGGSFLDDIAAFFADLHTMLDGFRARATEVLELLKRDDVAFVVVTSPSPRSIDEAIALAGRLRAGDVEPAAFVINRVHARVPVCPDGAELAGELAALDVPEALAHGLAGILLRTQQQMWALGSADEAEIARLKQSCGDRASYIEVPLLSHDVHDVAQLARLTEFLRG